MGPRAGLNVEEKSGSSSGCLACSQSLNWLKNKHDNKRYKKTGFD
jgi:hypothetical protein